MKKLYVGNLPYSMTEAELEQLFSKYGPVASSTVIMDRTSGRSKGFGFVELENDSMAELAISELNGTDLSGRNLVVNEARPMVPNTGGQAFRGGSRGGSDSRGSQGGFNRKRM